MCMFGLAPLVAGPLGGVIYDAISPSAVFVFAAGVLGLAGVVMLFAGRRGRMG